MVFCFIQKFFSGREHAQIMKITNGFFNPISAFAQTNLIIELKSIFFLQNLTLGYMTKTLKQIFFACTKIRIYI
jgi:hypothetical protein